MLDIVEHLTRSVKVSVHIKDCKVTLKTTSYGDTLDIYELFRGLDGKSVVVTVEKK